MSMSLFPEFEHRNQPVLKSRQFLFRLAYSTFIGLVLIAVSLLGPVHTPVTPGGKLFAGLYALYCGLAVIAVAGVMLAPVVHRLLHKLHVESGKQKD
jgi:hypothetical protein